MGVLKIVGLGIIAIIVIAILVVGYFGFIPGVSDVMGTNKAKDLGVSYSQADYASGLEKIPGHVVVYPEGLCITCAYTSTGSVPVHSSFTEQEFTAQMNKLNSTKGPLRNVQVKFNADGSIETSGVIQDPKFTNAFYAKGKIVSASGKNVQIELDQSELGRVGLTGDQAKKAQEIVNAAVNDFITDNPGLSITSLSVSDGQINFDGTFPEKMEGNPNAVPEDVISKFS